MNCMNSVYIHVYMRIYVHKSLFIGVQPCLFFPASLCRMESQHVVKLPIQSFKDTFTFPQFLVFLFVLCAGNKAVEARTQITDW